VIGLFFLSPAKESEPFSDQWRHVAWFLDDGVTIREKHQAHLAPHARPNEWWLSSRVIYAVGYSPLSNLTAGRRRCQLPIVPQLR
jgi:hypothetical protein